MKKLILLLPFILLLLCCDRPIEDKSQYYGDLGPDAFEDTALEFTESTTEEALSETTFQDYSENPFVKTKEQSVSTFSIDADGGSYAIVRRYIQNGQLPPPGAVRPEEIINYFDMDYPEPEGYDPIAMNGEISSCPWATGHQLLRIGLSGRDFKPGKTPNSNFVFLIDVSGSMDGHDRLDLLKTTLIKFVESLGDHDKISIVTYGSNAQVALPSTSSHEKRKIIKTIDRLGAGGSTAGAEGIRTAYKIAQANFIEGGNNRVILGTDGDFNVGISSESALVKLIEQKRERKIFLSVLGVGLGNYQDHKMEQLANKGNGTYEYLDNIKQAEKVFIHEYKKFFTVAKDVKIQVDFNPDFVKAYRLVGYENRALDQIDFKNDKKDAGEIGATQNITALYEIIPTIKSFVSLSRPAVTVDYRYKYPEEDQSRALQYEIPNHVVPFRRASAQQHLSAAAVGFAMLLRDSEHKKWLDYDQLIEWAESSLEYDPHGYRKEFVDLLKQSKKL